MTQPSLTGFSHVSVASWQVSWWLDGVGWPHSHACRWAGGWPMHPPEKWITLHYFFFFFAILALRGSHHESAREEILKFCFSVSPICTHSAQDPSSFATQYKICLFVFFNRISGDHSVGSLSSDQIQTSSQNSVTYLKRLFFSSFCC